MKQAALFLKLGLLSTVMVLFPVLFLAGSLACAQSTSKNSLNLSKELQNLEHLKVYPADSQPAFDIRLEPKATYQDGGDVLFGRQLTSIKIDEKGRVYVLDFGQQTIHVFNPDGSFLKDVGRKGRGPGEFLYIADMQIDDENLYVLDSHQTKISVFKEGSFKHLRDVNISLKNTDPQPAWLARTRKNKTFYRPNNFIVRPDGKYLIIFNDNAVAVAFNLPGRTDEFSLFDPAKGAYIKHNVLTFKWTGGVLIHKKGGRSDILFNVPYKRQSKFSYANNQLVYGWTRDFLFKFYDENGVYQRAFYYPFPKVPLTEKGVLAFFGNTGPMKQLFDEEDLPATWPAFHSLTMDDKNRLWVSTFVAHRTDIPMANQMSFKWLVLAPTGKLLATFRWPQSYKLEQVKNGNAYTLQRDKKTGLQSVVKYHINMDSSKQ